MEKQTRKGEEGNSERNGRAKVNGDVGEELKRGKRERGARGEVMMRQGSNLKGVKGWHEEEAEENGKEK